MKRGRGACKSGHPFARCARGPITLSAQAYLQRFYEGLGFAATSPYDDFGVPHIDMVRLAEY